MAREEEAKEELRVKIAQGILEFHKDIEQDPQQGDAKLIARLVEVERELIQSLPASTSLDAFSDVYLEAMWQSALRKAGRDMASAATQGDAGK